jgi:hypothetical protein
MREADMQKSHGLKATLPQDGQLEDIKITVVSGTFDQLLDALRQASPATPPGS